MLRPLIAPEGVIWISWPKKSAGRPTDLSEDAIRAEALPLDLVDIKVCAVNTVWSGLKFMIAGASEQSPARDRPGLPHHIMATGGAGSSGLPALVSGSRIMSSASSARTTRPARYEGCSKMRRWARKL